MYSCIVLNYLQEAALDNIQKGVTGLKHHAIAINDEVLEHNVIIDELGQVRPY